MTNHKLHLGDNLATLKNYPDNTFDSIVTSPPYNKLGLRKGTKTSTEIWKGANIEYSLYEDNMLETEYQQWQIEVINECLRVLKPNGSFFYQHKIRNWERIGYHPMVWIAKSNAIFYQEIIWHRKSTTSIDARYLYNTTERIYWLVKGKPDVFKDQMDETYKSDVWVIAPTKDTEHPASYPVSLVEHCLRLTMNKPGKVLDPFMGSGSTGMAAVALGHHFTGCELDPKYIAIAETRINAWTGADTETEVEPITPKEESVFERMFGDNPKDD